MSRKGSDPVVLGRIRGVFGVKGQVRVESFTAPPENILEYARWRVNTRGGLRVLCPLEGRWQGPGLVVRLGTEAGGVIADRESALALLDAEISVPRAELPEPAEGEVYWADLVGLRVVGGDGGELGRVARVIDNPAHPILELDGEPPLLIPFVRGPIIEDVDLDAGTIHTSWTADHAL